MSSFTQCAQCNRVVYATDVNAERLCVLCAPVVPDEPDVPDVANEGDEES